MNFNEFENFIYLNTQMTKKQARAFSRDAWNRGLTKYEAIEEARQGEEVLKANGNPADEYSFKTISGNFTQGETVTVETVLDGKRYTRKVKNDRWDLYIMIKGSRCYWSSDRV